VRAVSRATTALVLAAGLALAAGLVLASCGSSGSTELRVLAAASLVDVFAQLETIYEDGHPDIDVVVQTGGSTQLATQILEGAPAHVFASANEASMTLVTATPDGVFATNGLVVATPRGNPGMVSELADLSNDSLVVAMCAPAVPCGDLTQAVLTDEGLSVSPDTEEPNVRSVLNKVILDEVDAGLVYRSDAAAAGDAVVTLEIDSPRVNRYPIVGLSDSAAALEFVQLVLSPAATALFEEAGFGAP
jgi:molybdate transport system substrate-binding protein